jgi:hypothetical protein
MKLLKLLFLFLWQLPQNIIGAICTLNYDKLQLYYARDGDPVEVYFKKWFRSGVSLGDTIILDSMYYDAIDWTLYKCIDHEYGHQRQSKILGPFYLILIGIPSLLGNLVFRLFKINSKYYYKQPWERWADKLGGVTRG